LNNFKDIKTIELTNSEIEYMTRLFFFENHRGFIKKFKRSIKLDKSIYNSIEVINDEDIKEYVDLINSKDFRSPRPCFAFTSNNLTTEPLRLYLNSYNPENGLILEDFSLASQYYIYDLETGKITIT